MHRHWPPTIALRLRESSKPKRRVNRIEDRCRWPRHLNGRKIHEFSVSMLSARETAQNGTVRQLSRSADPGGAHEFHTVTPSNRPSLQSNRHSPKGSSADGDRRNAASIMEVLRQPLRVSIPVAIRYFTAKT